MKELLEEYSLTDLLLYAVVVYFALKEFLINKDWLVNRLKSVFDKDYKADEERKRLEGKVGDLEKFYAEKQRVDEGFEHLKQTDKEILERLTVIEKALNESIRVNDDRNADSAREYILRFNMELVRNLKHTREDFIEVLAKIDEYEKYCASHSEYKNNRAVSAINNVKRVYEERLQKHDFL